MIHKLLEEMRAVQAYLPALADGGTPPPITWEPPNLAAFTASLSSAWCAGEIRPTFSVETEPRYLLSLQRISARTMVATPPSASRATASPATASTPAPTSEKPQPIFAERGRARIQALRMAWPIVCRRLDGLPNINGIQLFEELCIRNPG